MLQMLSFAQLMQPLQIRAIILSLFITLRSLITMETSLSKKLLQAVPLSKKALHGFLSAMEDVVTKGTGTACQLDNMTVAGKTGTTDKYNDLWFVGYTPYYTCAVWSGFDNNEKLPDDFSRDFHKNLWKKVMTRVHEGLPDQEFEMPSTVEKISVCSETGLLQEQAVMLLQNILT